MSQKKINGGPKSWNMTNLNTSNCKLVKRENDNCVEFSNSVEQTRG